MSYSYGVEKFCLNMPEAHVQTLMVKNAGSKEALRLIGNMMEEGSIKAFEHINKPDQYFEFGRIQPQNCVFLKTKETLKLTVNDKSGTYVPFVNIDQDKRTASYGLIHTEELKKGSFQPVERRIGFEDILSYDVDPKAVILYVLCPPDRNELCTLRIKHGGSWYRQDGKIFELKVLARSRRERGEPNTSQRILKDGDTPQGLYHLWGTLFTQDLKYGRVPRIDIDGMQPPMHFEHGDSPNITRVLPKDTFLDYWVHEFPLSFAMGRYLFRIHDNSVDPNYPDTYTTPESKRVYRATAGCINTGDEMNKLLKILQKLNVLTEKHIQDQTRYGRMEIENVRNAFLVVLDVEDDL